MGCLEKGGRENWRRGRKEERKEERKGGKRPREKGFRKGKKGREGPLRGVWVYPSFLPPPPQDSRCSEMGSGAI